MATKYVLFAPHNSEAAEAYEFWCREQDHPLSTIDPWYMDTNTSPWSYIRDRNGNYVVAYYGPPFPTPETSIEEPAGGEEMRLLGVLVDMPEFPEE